MKAPIVKTAYEGKLAAKKRMSDEIWQHRHIYVILLPAVLFYLLFCYLPMFGTVIAFQKFSVAKGVFKSPFVGLEHFRSFLSDYNFWRLLRNTISISGYGLLFGFPTPIIFALLLNELKAKRFKRLVQTVTYMPHFISVVIVASLTLTFVSNDGVINTIRAMIGVDKVSFMSNPKYFYPVYTVSVIWQNFGWNSIIYLATLASVDVELYEAAVIDGANRWKQLLHITLPCIAPTIIILLILQIGNLLSVGFERIMLMYNPSVYERADVISTYVYRRGLLNGDYSYSAAVGMFNSIINFILLIGANSMSKYFSDTSLW
ncbi:MAG: ABC transporter permease subunit [Firmicutes bacterium]|nr:ABC transporter permease subunit [Bacillota bacterium]